MDNVIEFYRPANFKPVPRKATPVAIPEQTTDTSPVDLLRQVTVAAENAGISDVLIVTQDNDGATGMLTTLEGAPEILLMLEQVKARLVQNSMGDTTPQPNRSA